MRLCTARAERSERLAALSLFFMALGAQRHPENVCQNGSLISSHLISLSPQQIEASSIEGKMAREFRLVAGLLLVAGLALGDQCHMQDNSYPPPAENALEWVDIDLDQPPEVRPRYRYRSWKLHSRLPVTPLRSPNSENVSCAASARVYGRRSNTLE